MSNAFVLVVSDAPVHLMLDYCASGPGDVQPGECCDGFGVYEFLRDNLEGKQHRTLFRKHIDLDKLDLGYVVAIVDAEGWHQHHTSAEGYDPTDVWTTDDIQTYLEALDPNANVTSFLCHF